MSSQYSAAETWWYSNDTGTSSETIWCYMMGHRTYAPMRGWGPRTPSDADDFGRCYRLLKAFPEWRTRLHEMASEPGWRVLVSHWEELEALYEAERYSELTDRIIDFIRNH